MKLVSEKNGIVVLLLCLFIGQLGLHHFYVGKTGKGITLLALTLIGYVTLFIIIGLIPLLVMAIWVLVDLIKIVTGKFTDAEGNIVKL